MGSPVNVEDKKYIIHNLGKLIQPSIFIYYYHTTFVIIVNSLPVSFTFRSVICCKATNEVGREWYKLI
jgi:hypothetical protein